MGFSKRVVSQSSVLKQPEFSNFIYERRQLTNPTQVQTKTFSVTYTTINQGENRPIQPSPLVKQIWMPIEQLSPSSSKVLRERSQRLLAQYLSKAK